MATSGNDPEPDPGPPKEEDKLLTPDEVAAKCGGRITGATVARRYKKWGLHAVKVGRELRFWESEVYEWFENRRT
jgi:predicted DNA-binding transcriptional regulator AlpA